MEAKAATKTSITCGPVEDPMSNGCVKANNTRLLRVTAAKTVAMIFV